MHRRNLDYFRDCGMEIADCGIRPKPREQRFKFDFSEVTNTIKQTFNQSKRGLYFALTAKITGLADALLLGFRR